MPESPTPTVVPTLKGRRSQTRSVWGCLTCRRRKVKCRSRATPCETCRRLGIACTPSFASNFKEWKSHQSFLLNAGAAETTPSNPEPQLAGDSHSGPVRLSPYASPSPSEDSPSASFSSTQGAMDGPDQGADDWVLDQLSWDPVPPQSLDQFASRMPPSLWPPYAGIQEQCSIKDLGTSDSLSVSALPAADNTDPDYIGFDEPPSNSSLSYLDVLSIPTGVPFPNDLGSYFSIYSLNPRLGDEHTLVNYYNRHLSSFFSMKPSNSTWNFYSYAIRSTEDQPDSPLRHSILAWTSAHLMLKNQSVSEDTRYRHYARARSAVDDLLSELTMEANSSNPPQSTSKKLSILLSTSLFLSYCDVVCGDNKALANGLTRIKRLLESQWERFRERLGPLESRILVWLAYLDLRSSFWIAAEPPQPVPASSAAAEQNRTRERGELFNFLMNRKGISSLRSSRGGRYFLTECFGASYPEQELKDDLLQEPAKLLSDDAMSIFSNILEFEAWDDTTCSKPSNHGPLIDELRCAKVQAIRANIARVRAECKVIHAELLQSSTGTDHVARTDFHCSTTTALHLSATILLNRIVSPDVRTDEEAQAASREIVHIARRLRQSGYLCSPRSLIWPIPIFIAGVEITDEIYQDWILDYMRELAGLGTSTAEARELLRRIMENQKSKGRRIKVRDAMKDFAYKSHVLV